MHDKLNFNHDIINEYLIYSKTDLKGNIIDVTNAFCNISGYSKGELIGSNHNIVRHPNMSSDVFEDMWSTIQVGKSWNGIIKNRKKNGNYYWVETNISFEYDDNGKIEYYVAIRHDITARKEFEEQHVHLLEIERRASSAEMISNIAHQWRQPLSVISTIASSIEFSYTKDSKPDAEVMAKNMNTIVDKSEELSNTIDDLSDAFSNKGNLHEVIIQDEIWKSINMFTCTVGNKCITLNDKCKLKKDLGLITVGSELSSAISNILNNSKDAFLLNKIENPLINITLECGSTDVVIIVEDNAGGIAFENLNKVFEPYFTTKHKNLGTGLGLHSVHKIITDSLNGKIQVRNTNSGAQFTMHIPLNRRSEERRKGKMPIPIENRDGNFKRRANDKL